jgi:hypothetical protein
MLINTLYHTWIQRIRELRCEQRVTHIRGREDPREGETGQYHTAFEPPAGQSGDCSAGLV